MLKGLFDAGYKEYKRVEKIANQIDNLKDEYRNLTDEELQSKTVEFRQRLSQGEQLSDITVEAFATVREAAYRVLGLYPFKVQLIGALALHGGSVAEMKTGEGKTLTATLTAYLNALSKEGVHIVTVNEYLASRDATEMGKLFKWLGLTVGLNLNDMNTETKKEQYLCDIMYTTCSEVGFDYLRDNMASSTAELVQRPLNFAIIDEADSILIDEARTPLIISGVSGAGNERYLLADKAVKNLINKTDYIINKKDNNVRLTESGISKVEQQLNINQLYGLANLHYLHYVENALRANYIYKLDVDYVVEEDQIILVDQFTGRLMYGRQLSDGLHQAIEAKERVFVNEKSVTYATITIQNFFRMYKKLSGMTGTAKTEEDEFISIYNMYVVEVPTNRPMIRIDESYLFFFTEEEKYQAIAEEVKKRYEIGQPVLIGTTSIEKSMYLSGLFKDKGIPHQVLNAYHYAEEAKIVEQAGQKYAVTIATNMAGRGTDIKLGPDIAKLGGLLVIGTEIHEAKRIDNQLRGRSGRQGDPGCSKFYVSLMDEIFIRFVSDDIKSTVNPDYFDNPEGVISKYYTKVFEAAQRKVESINFSVRKRVLSFDEVMRKQRDVIYHNRMRLLLSDEPLTIIGKIANSLIDRLIRTSTKHGVIDREELVEKFRGLGIALTIDNVKSGSELQEVLSKSVNEKLEIINSLGLADAVRKNVLMIMSSCWMRHIDTMDSMKQAMALRRYGQIDDLSEYRRIGTSIFEDCLITIENETVRNIVGFLPNNQ